MTHPNTIAARSDFNRSIRRFFYDRAFYEVETPIFVSSAGTDPYLQPFTTSFQNGAQNISGHLQTSPEFAMKELIVDGQERIFQICKTFRNGERTHLHNPEFTILEWYRAPGELNEIIEDTLLLIDELLPESFECRVHDHKGPIQLSESRTLTMDALWLASTGLSLITLNSADALYDALVDADLKNPVHGHTRWNDLPEQHQLQETWEFLFFETMVNHVDPYLKTIDLAVITEWPTPLAVLAEKCPHDPRVASRFEIYIGGIEIANGFQELTDPVEQRNRFEADNSYRQQNNLPTMPIPERFLAALERGLPRCSGVAVGIDRLLMLKTGAQRIADVLPFAIT